MLVSAPGVFDDRRSGGDTGVREDLEVCSSGDWVDKGGSWWVRSEGDLGPSLVRSAGRVP